MSNRSASVVDWDGEAVSDEALWAEVERRELVTLVGYVNPDGLIEDTDGRGHRVMGHMLWESTWVNRLPVYGLRGGDHV